MTDTNTTHVLRLDRTTAELVADVLTEAADQRTRAARKGAGALQAEAAQATTRFDKRPAAVKITDLLAEANLLDSVAQAARAATTEPAAGEGKPPRPPKATTRRTRKAAGGGKRPDGTRDPEAGPTEADAAIALAAIEDFNANTPPLPDPDGVDGELLDGDDADLDPAETGAAAEDLEDPDLHDDELDIIGLSDPDSDDDLEDDGLPADPEFDVDDDEDEHAGDGEGGE